MQKKFISNLVLIILLNLLVKPVAIFGIDATVQNRVGAEDYGIYFSLLNFSLLFNILLDFGINNFTTKHIAQYPKIAVKHLGKVLTFRLVLFALYAVFSFTIALVLNWNSYELYLLGILVFNQFLVAIISYFRSYFGGLLLFKTDALISVLDRILLILICGYILFVPNNLGDFQIEWFIWLQTICYGLTLIVGFLLLIKRTGMPQMKYKPVFSLAIIRKSFPYALLILLMMIYTRTDSVMIERIHVNGKAETGYYAQGFRLLNAFFMFAMIFSNLLFPLFSRMFRNKQDVRPLFMTAANLLIGVSVVLSVASYFNSEFILSLIYQNDVAHSGPPFRYIMLSFVGMCGTLIFGTLLTAKGDLCFLNILSGIGILVNVILNILLIPKYGAEGAAIATLATQTTVALIQFFQCVSILKIQPGITQITKSIAFAAVVFGLFFFIEVENIWVLMALIGLSFVSMFLFRLIDLGKLKTILQSETE